MTEYDLPLSAYKVGDRIETHPATDAWMSGDRFGEVTKIGRKYIHVLMDRSEKTKQFDPGCIGKCDVELVEYDKGDCQIHREPVVSCDNSIENAVIGGITYFPGKAQVFNVAGMKVSTRSSKPWKRKLAKKLAEKVK